jgi:hypothetical protein
LYFNLKYKIAVYCLTHFALQRIGLTGSFMQTFVQLVAARCTEEEVYEIYLLFKDKNISKSDIYQTIKDCESGLPCVVKAKIAKPCVAEKKKKLRNVLQSIKNGVGASSRLSTLQFFGFLQKTMSFTKKNSQNPRQPTSRDILVAVECFFANIFVTKK